MRGALLRQIPHYDPIAAQYMIEQDGASGLRPVIVADGFCLECGRTVPLLQYLRCVIPAGGYVVLDDTQALGILGQTPDGLNPYGYGGGGSLRLHNIRSPASNCRPRLSRRALVGLLRDAWRQCEARKFKFMQRSETRVHASPPSIAVLHAAKHALMVNAERGDAIRRHLAELVTYFRQRIGRIGFSASQNPFPAQTLASDPHGAPVRLHRMLRAAGVHAPIVRKRTTPGAKLVFLFNASHSIDNVDEAVNAMAAAVDTPFARRQV